MCDLLWSDPEARPGWEGWTESPRGAGCLFGMDHVLNVRILSALEVVQREERTALHRASAPAGDGGLQTDVRRQHHHGLVGSELLLSLWKQGLHHAGKGKRRLRVFGWAFNSC